MSSTRQTYRLLLRLLLFAAGWLSLPSLHATEIGAADSSSFHLREFDAQKMEQYKSDPDFQYEREQLNMSWWERFKEWLRNIFRDLDPDVPEIDTPEISTPPWLGVVGNMLIILLVVVLVAGIVLLIVKGSGRVFSKGKKSEEEDIVATEEEENINDLPIADMLTSAIEGRQWRTAVRILYLRSLKALSDNGHIHWESQKTNYDYLRELQAAELKAPFGDLTRLFEYIWYGEFPVDKSIFEEANESFTAFDQQIRRKQ